MELAVQGVAPEVLQRLQRQYTNAFTGCYLPARARDPDVAGTVRIGLTVDAAGETAAATVTQGIEGAFELDECTLGRARRMPGVGAGEERTGTLTVVYGSS